MDLIERWTNTRRIRRHLRRHGVRIGTDISCGDSVYLSPRLLKTHLHILGPTGEGKTRLLLQLFENLIHMPDATVIVFNPKGDLCRHARDLTIESELSDRLVLFDPSYKERIIAYNPLRPNGLPPATHVKLVREAICSAWGQESLDQTPQLARFLYLALYAAREHGLTLVEAVRLLRVGSEMRETMLGMVQDPFVREALEYLHHLKPARQDELTSSTLARLEAFVMDPTIRQILTQNNKSLDLDWVIGQRKILLVNLEVNRPLRSDDVALLGRLLLNDLLAHVFGRARGSRGPVFLLLDEVQTWATEDLCTALEQGRELGLHCVLSHQQISQLDGKDGSHRLRDAVLTNARTKIVFGGSTVEDLKTLTEEIFIDQFDPWRVKDEITTLELDPVESRREVVSSCINRAATVGGNEGTTHVYSRTRMRGLSQQSGKSRTISSMVSSGYGVGQLESAGATEMLLPGGEALTGSQESTGLTETRFSGRARSHGVSSNRGRGSHRADAEGLSHAQQRGKTWSMTEGGSSSSAWVPFYEYRKRRVVSSRSFLSAEEFFLLCLQRLQAQPIAHFVVKTPRNPAVFMRAPNVPDFELRPELLSAFLTRVLAQSFYSWPEEVLAEEKHRIELLEAGPKDSADFDLEHVWQESATKKRLLP